VLERNEGGADNWGEVRKLTASDPAADDRFGYSVSISGNTAVVGAYRNDDAGTSSGSAYVFERNQGGADNWGEVRKLTASDAAAGDLFGYSVSIHGNTIVVGAYGNDASSGSAYVYERNQGGVDNWGEVRKLTAAAGDFFGISISIEEATVVVGAPGNDDAGTSSGSAYVFERNQGGSDNWGEVRKLTASDAYPDSAFGRSVSLSGDTLVVGSDINDAGALNAGAAYVFERNTGGTDNWGESRKLTAPDAAEFDNFGSSVSISGDTVVVATPRTEDAGPETGSAYVFARNVGGADAWGFVQKLIASDAAAFDDFGADVSVAGDRVLVGAPGAGDVSGGAVYVLNTNCPICGDGDATDPGEACDDGNTVGGDGCSADCSVAASGVPGEASSGGNMQASRAGSSIDVAFAPACAATDHAAYWGLGPITGAPEWTGSACGLGTGGAATFDPGVSLLPGAWLYFVIVGHDGDDEGSYGVDSTPAQRPEAVGIGSCDRPLGSATCG
jgi:cysteine-rich repeat protein